MIVFDHLYLFKMYTQYLQILFGEEYMPAAAFSLYSCRNDNIWFYIANLCK